MQAKISHALVADVDCQTGEREVWSLVSPMTGLGGVEKRFLSPRQLMIWKKMLRLVEGAL